MSLGTSTPESAGSPPTLPAVGSSIATEWLWAVLGQMTEEVYFTDTQGRYTCVNAAAAREFRHGQVEGVAVSDIIDKLEVLRPDGTVRPKEEAPPLRALRGEIITREEQVVRTPRTGELRHRVVNAAPVRNAAGDIVGSVCVVRDITDIKRSSDALAADLRDTSLLRDLAVRQLHEDSPPGAESSQLFEDIVDAAIMMMRAQAGTIQLLDEGAAELTTVASRGFPPELTARFARVTASPASPRGRALARGTRAFTRFDVPADEDPDELRLHLECGLLSAQSTPLFSRSGRLLGMFSTHWNTHRVLDDRELRLLDLLSRQAADLIERMRKDEALREADRRKDEFIAVLAHELRNPLVPIRTGIELLKNAHTRPDLVETVRPMMERQIAHMVRLIDDLLDVARIAAGKFELKRERAPLATIVGNAVDAQRRAIDAAGLTLQVTLPHPEVLLDVDGTRLSQVLSNLLHNATKFTPSGGRIWLQAARSGSGLSISIRDTGRGIAPDQLPKIFDLFAQSSERATSHEGGLGLGLTIARKLVEMHGGRIDARSEGAGRGTEFAIELPLADEPAAAIDTPPKDPAKLDELRVLVVDDNRDAADSMAMLVQLAGARTRTAYSAVDALRIVQEFAPRVVLLDIGMPGMDGYAACRRLRAEHGQDIAIVAVSGWGQDSDKRLALGAGFDAHLTKPADPDELAATIARLQGRRPGA